MFSFHKVIIPICLLMISHRLAKEQDMDLYLAHLGVKMEDFAIGHLVDDYYLAVRLVNLTRPVSTISSKLDCAKFLPKNENLPRQRRSVDLQCTFDSAPASVNVANEVSNFMNLQFQPRDASCLNGESECVIKEIWFKNTHAKLVKTWGGLELQYSAIKDFVFPAKLRFSYLRSDGETLDFCSEVPFDDPRTFSRLMEKNSEILPSESSPSSGRSVRFEAGNSPSKDPAMKTQVFARSKSRPDEQVTPQPALSPLTTTISPSTSSVSRPPSQLDILSMADLNKTAWDLFVKYGLAEATDRPSGESTTQKSVTDWQPSDIDQIRREFKLPKDVKTWAKTLRKRSARLDTRENELNSLKGAALNRTSDDEKLIYRTCLRMNEDLSYLYGLINNKSARTKRSFTSLLKPFKSLKSAGKIFKSSSAGYEPLNRAAVITQKSQKLQKSLIAGGLVGSGIIGGAYIANDKWGKGFSIDWFKKVENNTLAENEVLVGVIETSKSQNQALIRDFKGFSDWSANFSNASFDKFVETYKDENDLHLWTILISDYVKLQELAVEYVLTEVRQSKLNRIADMAARGYLSTDLLDTNDLDTLLADVKTTVQDSGLELVLSNTFDYYRLRLVNSLQEGDQLHLRIKIPLVSKERKDEVALIKISSRPFACPSSECLTNSVLQIKLRDDLLAFKGENLVGTSKSSDWECSPNSEGRICLHSSSNFFKNSDDCIQGLLSRKLSENSCSVTRFDFSFSIKPLAISPSENYHTKLVNGELRGQVVKMGNDFDPKLPSWTIKDFVVGHEPKRSMFAQVVTTTEDDGRKGLEGRMTNLENQALEIGNRIQNEVNDLKDLAALYPPPAKLTWFNRLILELKRFDYIGFLLVEVVVLILIKRNLWPAVGFIFFSHELTPAIAAKNGTFSFDWSLVTTFINTAKNYSAQIEEEVPKVKMNFKAWTLELLDKVSILLIDWTILVATVLFLAILLYKIAFRHIRVIVYNATVDSSDSLIRKPNNVTMHIRRYESSLLWDVYHEIAINFHVPFIKSRHVAIVAPPQLIRNGCLVSLSQGKLISCSPIAYRYRAEGVQQDQILAANVDFAIPIKAIKWSNGVKYKFGNELYEATLCVNGFVF